jgi:mono/diheme cytochrome c family protein
MDPQLQREALAGFCADIPAEPEKARGRFVFAATPPALAAMQRTGRKEIVPLVQRILASVEIRAVAPAVASSLDEELSDAERARVAAGSRVYGAYCAACHQSDGQGLAGLAPPLAGSEWVGGDGELVIKIALHGLRGPLRAAGVAFEGEMTPQSHLGDADLAAALSYVRRKFAPRAACISAEDVARVRKQHEGRAVPWPAAELQPH